jgi:hypothetical protein
MGHQSLKYEMKMKPYVEYSEDILLHLLKLLPPQNVTLLEGFWPLSNWRPNYASVSFSIVMDIIDAEDPVRVPYSVLKNMRPLTAYTPFKDFNVGDFVLVRPHDPNLVHLWMGRVEGDII